MTGILSARYSTGEPFTTPLYYPVYSNVTGFVYATSVNGVVHRFNAETLIFDASLSLSNPSTFHGVTPSGNTINVAKTYMFCFYSIDFAFSSGRIFAASIDLQNWQVYETLSTVSAELYPEYRDQVASSGDLIAHTIMRPAGTTRVRFYDISAGKFSIQSTSSALSPVDFVRHRSYLEGKDYAHFFTYPDGSSIYKPSIIYSYNLGKLFSVDPFNGPPFDNGDNRFFGFTVPNGTEYRIHSVNAKAISKGKNLFIAYSHFRGPQYLGDFLIYYPNTSSIDSDKAFQMIVPFSVQPITMLYSDNEIDSTTQNVLFVALERRFKKYKFTRSPFSINTTQYAKEDIINTNIALDGGMEADTIKKRFFISSLDPSTDDSKLYMVPFADCASRTNCSDCTSMADPYCGWCALDGKCSYKGTCSSGTLSNGWVQSGASCPSVNSVSFPTPISVGQGALTYTFTMTNVPTATYSCRFSSNVGKDIVVTATGSLPNLSCSYTNNNPLDTFSRSLSVSIVYDPSVKNTILRTFSNSVFEFDCGNMTTCQSCQATGYACGWCSANQVCSNIQVCNTVPSVPGSTFRWLSTGICPTIVSVANSVVHHRNPQARPSMTVNVDYITNVSLSGWACVYTRSNGTSYVEDLDSVQYSNGPVSGNTKTITCKVPSVPLPLFNDEFEHLSVSVKIDSLDPIVAPANGKGTFTVFTCSKRLTCQTCVTHPYNCTWSSEFNICVDRFDIDYPSPSFRASDLASCPAVNTGQSFLVAQGLSNQKIRVTGKRLPVETFQFGIFYTCVFSNGFNMTGAFVDSNSIDCNVPNLSSNTGLVANVTLTVFLGSHVVQSPVLVSFYNCSHPTFDESCLTCNNPSLAGACGWCFNEGNAVLSYCSRNSECTSNGFSWNTGTCPPPIILSFTPQSGPLQGGTPIVIQGRNLGLSVQNVDYIRIGANGFCREISWINTNQLKCITDTVSFPQAGPVEVSIIGYDPVVSPTQFSLVDSQITSLDPNEGQIAGGSFVSINGKNLDAGKTFDIQFGEFNCRNITRLPNSITCISPPIDDESGKVVSVVVKIDDATLFANFTYKPNPTLSTFSPKLSHGGSGINVTIKGDSLLSSPQVFFGNLSAKVLTSSSSEILAVLPSFDPSIFTEPEEPVNLPVSVKFGTFTIRTSINFNAYRDPTIDAFNPKSIIIGSSPVEIFIEGTNLLRGGTPKITIANVPCIPKAGSNNNLLKCDIIDPVAGKGPVILEVNAVRSTSVEEFSINPPGEQGNSLVGPIVGSLAGLFLLLLIIGLIVFVIASKKNKKKREMLFQELDQANDQNMKVLSEVMEAYTEYNTRDKTFSNPLFGNTSISFTSFETYAIETLFPKDESVSPPAIVGFSSKSSEFKLISDFKKLLLNDKFATTFLKTMEKQSDFKVIDRKYTAAILMISLNANMDYATDLLFLLLKDYINDKVKSGEQKTILRATSTITEKYLTAWLAFTLFSHVQEQISKPLLNTFASIKGQIEKGAVDFLTGSSQYTINASNILRQKVNYERIKVKISYLDKTPIEIEINTCDCITQVVNTALFFFEGNTKNTPNVGLYDSSGKLLQDIDSSSERESGTDFIKLNTMEHYQIKTGSELKIMKKAAEPIDPNLKLFHLEKKAEGSAEQKIAPSEVFFTRMMTMREVIHAPVDSLFDSIFSKDHPPLAVKKLFDFLDKTAQELGVNDPETIHIWKNNSLALRFWVNLVTNPNQILDINKTVPIHNSLSTIGQVLMDSCSVSELKLGAGAPASKLLYKNEVEEYRKLVQKYYEHVRQSHLGHHTIAVSHQIGEKLDENSALYELRKYANKYSEQIKSALPSDIKSQFEQNIQS